MTYDITHHVDEDGCLVVRGQDGSTGFEFRLDQEMAAILRPLLPGFLRSPAGTIDVRSHGYDGDVVTTFEANDWDVTEDGHLEILSAKVPVAMYRSSAWIAVADTNPVAAPTPEAPDDIEPPADTMWRVPDGPIVHAVMYRDHQMGTLCGSGAWGTPELFTAVTEHVTCPGCRDKLDPGRS